MILSQFAPGLEAKEKKGAEVIVKKLDGKIFNGELLDVQGDRLTVLDRSTSSEVTASFLEIKEIDIAKKSARKNALVMGALAGAVIGGLCFASGEPDPNDDFRLTPASGAVAGALGGAFWASLIVGVSEQIDLENKTPEKIAKISARLQKYSKKGRNSPTMTSEMRKIGDTILFSEFPGCALLGQQGKVKSENSIVSPI